MPMGVAVVPVIIQLEHASVIQKIQEHFVRVCTRSIMYILPVRAILIISIMNIFQIFLAVVLVRMDVPAKLQASVIVEHVFAILDILECFAVVLKIIYALYIPITH